MKKVDQENAALIPPSEVVRVEQARSVRKSRRLRSLLKLSVQTEADRRFLWSLSPKTGATRPAADGRGVGR